MSNNVLTDEFSVPLNGATTAHIDINSSSGNLSIDPLPDAEQLLAAGTLQYLETQGKPSQTLNAEDGSATLTVAGRPMGKSWFHLPWTACIAGTNWQLHLNPAVSSEITAHTGGGNVRLELADMVVNSLSADTGGGNMEVAMPEHARDIHVLARTGGGNIIVAVGSDTTGSNTVDAKSGAGNVVVRIPRGLAARVHASSGLGKTLVEARFQKLDGRTYESADYDQASNKIEITVSSGAGNVTVNTS